MRAAHRAAAEVQRRGDDPIGAEPLEREDAADDVDDRVERADFVQVDVVDRHLVDVRFDRREPAEQRDRAIARRRRQRRAGDQPLDLGDVPVRMVLRARARGRPRGRTGPRGRARPPRHAAGTCSSSCHCVAAIARSLTRDADDRVVVETQAAERVAHGLERHAGVEAGAEEHVARDAGEAVEIKDGGHGSSAARPPDSRKL